jgi:uncharacterized protein (DUF2252 family)
MNSDPLSDGEPQPGAVSEAPVVPAVAPKKRKKKAKSNIVPLRREGGAADQPASPRPIRKVSGAPKQGTGTAAPEKPAGPELPSAALFAAGKALREKLPRQTHAPFKRDKSKVDPLAILRAQDKDRLKQLVPIRYGRMLQSPFTFYRGAAAVMAADLAKTPATGLRVQACGDCHLLNFGGFATPERNIVFDINDFDETLPAPWEWDVKRLVASFVLAGRSQGLKDSDGRDAAVACARSYRKRLHEYSEMSPLEIWYSRITLEDVIGAASASLRKRFEAGLRERVAKATAASSSDLEYPKLAGMVSGKIRIHDAPPLIFHPTDVKLEEWHARIVEALKCYRDSLSDERRELLDQYRLVDGAMKVVGIGSVGTRCSIILMMSTNNDPLFLQWKQAKQSVLEPYAGKSAYSHPGQRVVMGQKLMQSASDIFLGWATTSIGTQGYVRQLRDVKIKPMVETMNAAVLTQFAKYCGWALARAHAKAGGEEQRISGYLGNTDNFDEAMGSFAVAYADQTERDHAALKAAVRAGKIDVHLEQ